MRCWLIVWIVVGDCVRFLAVVSGSGRGEEVMMSGIVQGTKPSGPEPVG